MKTLASLDVLRCPAAVRQPWDLGPGVDASADGARAPVTYRGDTCTVQVEKHNNEGVFFFFFSQIILKSYGSATDAKGSQLTTLGIRITTVNNNY